MNLTAMFTSEAQCIPLRNSEFRGIVPLLDGVQILTVDCTSFLSFRDHNFQVFVFSQALWLSGYEQSPQTPKESRRARPILILKNREDRMKTTNLRNYIY